MSDDASFNIPSPGQIQANLFSNASAQPPVLPTQWSGTALLTPFGGLNASAPLSSSDELVVATIAYEVAQSYTSLRTRLYLLESELYYDFLFVTSAGQTLWYWLVSDPSDPNPAPPYTQASGPYSTPTQVPAAAFLGEAGFAYTGTWNVLNQSCDGYSCGGSNEGMTAATWFSFFNGTNVLSRIMNVDNTNDFNIPVLGAYYLVNFPTFETLASASPFGASSVELMTKGNPRDAGPSPMVTLQDIQTAMVNPPSGVSLISCSAQDIAAIIPGLSFPQSQPTPPAWTNQMQTFCYMMGQDTYPYYSQVYYDYTVNQTQISVFVMDASPSATPSYNFRQDMVLPLGVAGPVLNYAWNENSPQWASTCYLTPQESQNVPMPVPNFVQVAGGLCRAVIENNPYFGQGDTISIWSVALADSQSNWVSDFWYWFNSEQQGIVFSLAPAASLTMIDYQTFLQNPTFPAGTFSEPVSGLPQCPFSAADHRNKVMFIPKGGY